MTTGRINQIRPGIRLRVSEETLAQVEPSGAAPGEGNGGTM